MPAMMDIYKKFAANYDELVMAEDYQQNLPRFLHNAINWEQNVVYEAGIGTGRVTQIYIEHIRRCYGFDREPHMLTTCARNLVAHQEKIVLAQCDNTDLRHVSETVDVFIEGWSFGHTMHESGEQYRAVFADMYQRICDLVRSAGTIILIETLGTNVTEPTIPDSRLAAYYHHLETDYQFTRHIIPTDYRFSSSTEAARILGFFFGQAMTEAVMNTKQTIIPEFTGIWMRENA